MLGYTGAFVTGLTLGLLGGGGALMSIPVLVYFFHIDAAIATGYSLFLVGITALSGAFQNLRKGLIDYNAAVWCGVPSIMAVYVIRRFVVHNIPEVIFSTPFFTLDRHHLILSVLTLVMLVAGYKMIGSSTTETENTRPGVNRVLLVAYALAIGLFLGLVGAGGGFLMVPALVYFANLSMKKAVGTSLVLVSVNSFIGFMGDVHSNQLPDWFFLLTFSAFSIAGMLMGQSVAHRVNNEQLKRYFGWFMLLVALFIVVKEFILPAS